jgi:hypothetical protein
MDQHGGASGGITFGDATWRPKDFSPHLLEGAMERGDLRAVRWMLSVEEFKRALVGRGSTDLLEKAATWRRSAEQYEALNGLGSRLDPDHPFNRDVRPHLERHCQR